VGLDLGGGIQMFGKLIWRSRRNYVLLRMVDISFERIIWTLRLVHRNIGNPQGLTYENACVSSEAVQLENTIDAGRTGT